MRTYRCEREEIFKLFNGKFGMGSLQFLYIYTGKSAYFVIVTHEIYFHFVFSHPRLCILDGIVLFVIVPQFSVRLRIEIWCSCMLRIFQHEPP
jgi:hypothetical protein